MKNLKFFNLFACSLHNKCEHSREQVGWQQQQHQPGLTIGKESKVIHQSHFMFALYEGINYPPFPPNTKWLQSSLLLALNLHTHTHTHTFAGSAAAAVATATHRQHFHRKVQSIFISLVECWKLMNYLNFSFSILRFEPQRVCVFACADDDVEKLSREKF
jgi:hypothetical protein